MSRPVVVGVDGSAASVVAVELAAREAQLRGCDLRIVHAFVWPLLRVPLSAPPLGPPGSGLRNVAHEISVDAKQHAKATVPSLAVDSVVVTGEPISVLQTESADAQLVVVGSRGLTAFSGLLVGSVAMHLAAHAHCPVLVVRGRVDPDGPVLVGIDGSTEADGALDFAFQEAATRGTDLIAMHVWNSWSGSSLLTGVAESIPLRPASGPSDSGVEWVLTSVLARWRDRFPDVKVHRQIVNGRIRLSLLDATASSQLIVVGARGHGGFAGLLLGSVTHAVLQHAQCPAVVVRGS